MKFKIIIISFSVVFVSVFSLLGTKSFDKNEHEVSYENEIAQNLINDEVDEKSEIALKKGENEIIAQQEETEISDEIVEQAVNDNTQSNSCIKDSENIQEVKSVPKKQQEVEQVQQKQEETKVEKQEIIEEIKQDKPKELTPNDIEYWCVSGGNHHVAGDGANEHGYYKTWDEAYNAFLNYTANWSSSQYKISCCSCGLYYFWAIQ